MTTRHSGRALDPDQPCHCSSGRTWAACCGPIIAGERAATTCEELMRSRFSAFATGDARYLRASWHRSTRPTRLDLDPDQVWFRLTILQARGGPQDETGTVEFVAQYRNPDGRGRLHERSRFTRQDGCWVYLDGESG